MQTDPQTLLSWSAIYFILTLVISLVGEKIAWGVQLARKNLQVLEALMSLSCKDTPSTRISVIRKTQVWEYFLFLK